MAPVSRLFQAVRGIDLVVEAGTIVALLGTNGAGTTSALEVVEGLAPPTAGEVRVLGLDPVDYRAEVRRVERISRVSTRAVGSPRPGASAAHARPRSGCAPLPR